MGSLTTLPPEFAVGWALWLVAGLVLMLWFRRRHQAAPRLAVAVDLAAAPGASSSARRSGVRLPPARLQAPVEADPFAELNALLEQPDDSAPRG